MSEFEPALYRQRLVKMRQELQAQENADNDATATVELDQARVGRLSRMDALHGQQMAQAAVRRRKEMLQRVEGAPRRIEAGDFGFCYVCDEEIAPARLDIDPTITRCLACME